MQKYRVLSREVGGSAYMASEAINLSCSDKGGECPAIIEHGRDLLIIGRYVSSDETNLAVAISRELVAKAIAERSVAA
jgi:hypothetical protein